VRQTIVLRVLGFEKAQVRPSSNCAFQVALVPTKPPEMSFDEAAAIPHATMLAWQGLVESGKLQAGERLLLNGGGGGVGTFAL
jgi:NADPH:quinone reductase-like Zn-dependent oxidoreductase